MKKTILVFAILFGILSSAQTQTSENSKKIYLKVNALFLPLGMLNAGLEYQLNNKVTIQGDVFISPWKSLFNQHMQIYMGIAEGRYYFDRAFHKFYVGLNIGGAVFDITKWNYRDTNQYQRGFTLLAGATVGYQFQLNDRWNMDVFVGGGTSQGFYHGYDETDPNNLRFYSYDGRKWNRSGELIPYRGGVMIGYKL